MGSICGYNHSGSTFVNCYYLITGTEKGNYGVGMTQQQFASGEVCYALNAGNGGSVVWKQTCGTGFPGFGGKTVYRAQTYKNDGSTVFAYTNDSNKKVVTYTAPAPYTSPAYASSGESTGDNSDGHTHVYKEPEWNWKKYESAKATLTCQDCGEEFILKASVKKEVTEPTCTENGETVYKATVEKDGITFKDKRVVEKEKTGHKEYEPVIASAPATCEIPQCKIDCLRCPACGKYFDKDTRKELSKKAVETGTPLGHDYGNPLTARWNNAPNGATTTVPVVTATFTCQRAGCGKSTSVAATLNLKATKKASCTEAGTRTYEAVAKIRMQGTVQSCTDPNPIEVTIPQEKHDYKRVQSETGDPCLYCAKCKLYYDLNGTQLNPAPPSTTKDVPDSAPKEETLPMDETLPGDEDPSLPPDAEETQETPTPSEEQDGSDEADTPETPDGSGGVDAPGEPDGSGGQDTSDNPDTSDGADVPPVSDEPGTAENAEPYGLLCPEEEDGLIDGAAVSLRFNAAVKNMTQPAGEQQEISLWGLAIVLMLLVGIVLLIILQKKHN